MQLLVDHSIFEFEIVIFSNRNKPSFCESKDPIHYRQCIFASSTEKGQPYIANAQVVIFCHLDSFSLYGPTNCLDMQCSDRSKYTALFWLTSKDKSPAYSNFSDFSSKDLRLDIENVFLSAVNQVRKTLQNSAQYVSNHGKCLQYYRPTHNVVKVFVKSQLILYKNMHGYFQEFNATISVHLKLQDLKFMFSKKPTKIEKFFTVDLTLTQ